MKPDENFFKRDAYASFDGKASLRDLAGQSGEQVLWEGKPNRKAYLCESFLKMFPIALIWLLFDGAFIGLLVAGDAGSHIPRPLIAFLVVFFILHLAPVWMWIRNVVTSFRRLKNTEYLFTNTRIAIKSGFFVNVQNIFYSQIRSVDLKVGLTERIFKVGDVRVRTSGGSFTLEDLDDAYFIVERLQKLVNDIATDIQYPNALRPPENDGYNTKYNG